MSFHETSLDIRLEVYRLILIETEKWSLRKVGKMFNLSAEGL